VESQVRVNNRRGQRSRNEILDVASRIMAERGYTATTLSVLSTETGLPKSAVYHHFRSKAGLLTAVMARGAQGFYDAMRAAHARPPSTGTHRERLDWYLQRTAEVFLSRQDFLRLHMILILSAEADEADVAEMISQVRGDGRAYMHHMIASSFQDLGEALAAEIADRLDYFGIAGFDGAFIAMQADPSRSLMGAMHDLADAMVALGEAHLRHLHEAPRQHRQRINRH
jgi:AcrR family transcriptional regulator